MDLLNDFSPGLFIMQTIILLILIILMRKFAWKPILNSLQTREEGIKDALDKAEKAKAEFKDLKADNERILNEARAERDVMLKEAREMKERLILDAQQEAKLETEKIIAQAKLTIENDKKLALKELKKQISDFSVDIAEKILKKELVDEKQQYAFVESILDESILLKS